MEQDGKDQSASQEETRRAPVVTPAQGDVAGALPANEMPCPTCAGAAASMPASYVYAIGRIEARFPRLSVEKEFAQATGAPRPREKPTNRRSTMCCPSPRAGISPASYAGC